MKKLIINCLATTALSLLILALIASLHQAKFIFVSSIFQSFLVNGIIHLGLVFVQRIESKYFVMEILWEIGYVLLVLIPAGFLFDWYGNGTPLWMLVLMGLMIYLIGCFVNVMKINHDIDYINKKLKT